MPHTPKHTRPSASAQGPVQEPELTTLRRKRPKKTHRIRNGILISLASVLLVLFGGLLFILYGPFTETRDLFVTTVMETSALKFLATTFLGEEKVAEILANNTVVITDPPKGDNEVEVPQLTDEEKDSIEIIDITGPTFKGKLMIVKDPSRLSVTTAPNLGPEGKGMRTDEMIKREGAIAGINGGGFVDIGGVGSGGQPLGIVIQDGKVIAGGTATSYPVIGFDRENRLILGNMTGKEALEKGIRDAVSFEPFFIVNGQAAEVKGTGGGLNPRTVIGQRKDGAVLLLVIDGRQVNSLGASYKDCMDVMLEYEAYNAANLDGGSSSVLVYQDKIITNCSSLYGPRDTPTAFVVK